jgi:RNA polymerase sigma-70 factor (ECF subfamily)
MDQLTDLDQLRRYCLTLTKSVWDADDLVQDTWEKAVGYLRKDELQHPKSLLMTIARNRWIDLNRRNAVHSRILRNETPEDAADPPDSRLELETVFHALIKHLSPLQRAVFLLRDVFGYTGQETARLLNTTEGAAKAALFRARQAMSAVREDLEQGGLPLPQEEGLKALLQALAHSFASGEIATLLALVQRDELDAAVVIGQLTNSAFKQKQGSAIRGTSHTDTRMFAA